MGQYHYVANLDKREFLHPHVLGDGLKLMEFGSSGDGTMLGLALLLAISNGRGGGDFRIGFEHEHDRELADAILGRWGGDRIAIIGDYAEVDDIPGWRNLDPEQNPWEDEAGDLWTNISASVRRVIELDEHVHFRASWTANEADPYAILEKGVTP